MIDLLMFTIYVGIAILIFLGLRVLYKRVMSIIPKYKIMKIDSPPRSSEPPKVSPPKISKKSAVETIREREVIRERVLILCPFCSAKVEQGASFCPHCGGKL